MFPAPRAAKVRKRPALFRGDALTCEAKRGYAPSRDSDSRRSSVLGFYRVEGIPEFLSQVISSPHATHWTYLTFLYPWPVNSWVRMEVWSFGADPGVLGGRSLREAYIDNRELESEASEGSYLDWHSNCAGSLTGQSTAQINA
jgi:hypothetical protein